VRCTSELHGIEQDLKVVKVEESKELRTQQDFLGNGREFLPLDSPEPKLHQNNVFFGALEAPVLMFQYKE